MSQDDRSLSTLEIDIWRTLELIFRKMYLEENKTLKEVKEIMELRHGFPSFSTSGVETHRHRVLTILNILSSVSTYGAKLHNYLNLRKKLKKRDWPVVYQHYERRQAEGKQSHMYLNDTLIPWGKAWKEIRRNRARLELDHEQPALRPYQKASCIFSLCTCNIKTPPPPFPTSICNSSQLIQLSPPIQSLRIMPINGIWRPFGVVSHEPAQMALESRQSFNLNVPFPESLGGNILSRSARFYRQLSLMCLENTPWAALKATLLRGAGLTPTTTLHHQFLVHGVENPTSNQLSTQFDSMLTLAKVFYLISNNLFLNNYIFQERIVELFNLLCSRMPQRLVVDLLDSDLLPTNAAWEAIARVIYLVERKDFITFMRLGLNCPKRILPHAYIYLSVTASKNCTDIVRRLLELGARADQRIPEWAFTPFHNTQLAIFEAIACQDIECLQFLLEHCDVNVPVSSKWGQEHSISSMVLSGMGHYLPECYNGCWMLKYHQASLAILLEHGANVDIPCSKYHRLGTEILAGMEPSLLEHCYFYNKAIYYQLVVFSSRTSQRVYRDEICFAATQGASALLAYFNSKSSVDATFLEYVLEEQFLLNTSLFDSAVVRALLELGMTISTPSPDKEFTELLCRVIDHIQNHVFILKSLLRKGALLNSEVLALAVEHEGTGILELLLTLGGDFRREGARALGTAARLNNFCAVSWLLQRDVDVNAGIEGNGLYPETIGSVSVTMATQMWFSEFGPALGHVPNIRMLKYLMHHGAKLWCGSRDSCPFKALRVILRRPYSHRHLFDTVNLILDHSQMLKDLPYSGSFLLEDSLVNFDRSGWSATEPKSRVFELLLKHGAPVYPGAVLARLIDLAAPHQFVLDLMNRGADINAYTTYRTKRYNAIQAASKWWNQSLVSTLLERGGDINSPALGLEGETALQVACSVTATSEVDRRAQITFVEYLLRNNADVNAPPCTEDLVGSPTKGGYTALQLAAAASNLELMSLLLSHKAHVNLPSHSRRRCALDVAAERGRLDALHFLLKAGALSYCYGQSGYEGAIQLGECKRFFVVADSLRRHIRDNERLFYEQLALAEAHSAVMAERSWTDECFSLIG
ncbi:hypothetical protein RRF57_000893 [Xylaria bambusicola]|uniref:Clr5 domain-containing protein n=1 Tax=Xylaria bambusicola TaxID=326684 RepID=A0AAN7Z143_9PEZI